MRERDTGVSEENTDRPVDPEEQVHESDEPDDPIRRAYLKGLVTGAAAAFVGASIGYNLPLPVFSTRPEENVEPFEGITLAVDDEEYKYRITRISPNQYIVEDTRTALNNTLHPDRESYLYNTLAHLQNVVGCDIFSTAYNSGRHNLMVVIPDDQCLIDYRDRTQQQGQGQ